MLNQLEQSTLDYYVHTRSRSASQGPSNMTMKSTSSSTTRTTSRMDEPVPDHDSRLMDNPPGTSSSSQIRKTITVFYHTFANPNKIPSSKNAPSIGGARSVLTKEQTMAIVSEQMQQIAQAAHATRGRYDWNVRYASVGEAGVINASWVQSSFCQAATAPYYAPNLHCQYLGHELEGHEEVTLQRLHDFCRNSHPESIVIYVHTKGTFHAHEANDEWRRMLTKAVLKESCLQSLDDNHNNHGENHSSSACDVCGLQFYPIWITMFPGNFFATRCSYVRQLLPVDQHSSKMAEIVESVKASRRKIWITRLYPWQNDVLGAGRWSKEAWIASHPNLRPCDLAGNITQLFLKVSPDMALQHIRQSKVLPAPRIAAHEGDWYRRSLKALQRATSRQAGQRPHEYFLLPGQLYRYYKLYGQFPPDESWVWQWYPHGKQWREKVQRVLNNTGGGGGGDEGTGKLFSLEESLLW